MQIIQGALISVGGTGLLMSLLSLLFLFSWFGLALLCLIVGANVPPLILF